MLEKEVVLLFKHVRNVLIDLNVGDMTDQMMQSKTSQVTSLISSDSTTPGNRQNKVEPEERRSYCYVSIGMCCVVYTGIPIIGWVRHRRRTQYEK